VIEEDSTGSSEGGAGKTSIHILIKLWNNMTSDDHRREPGHPAHHKQQREPEFERQPVLNVKSFVRPIASAENVTRPQVVASPKMTPWHQVRWMEDMAVREASS